MKTVKRFAITRATHGEMANLAEKMITILTTALAGNTFIMGVLVILQKSLEKLNLAITAVRENSYAALLNLQDETRDNAYIMFCETIALYSSTQDESKKEAYLRIWPILENTGTDLYYAENGEESTLLLALFQELNKTECQADIELLNATIFYDQLILAQNDFLAIEANCTTEDTLKDYPTLKASRKEINPLMEDLLSTIQNVIRTESENNPAVNFDWADSINEHIELVSAQIAARTKKRKMRMTSLEEELSKFVLAL